MKKIGRIFLLVLLGVCLAYIWYSHRPKAPEYHPRDYAEIAQEGILYAKSSRDSLIIYAINNKMTLRELNSFLTDHELDSLA